MMKEVIGHGRQSELVPRTEQEDARLADTMPFYVQTLSGIGFYSILL